MAATGARRAQTSDQNPPTDGPPQGPDPYASIPGAFTDPKEISQRLRWASEHWHLIAPMTTCSQLPLGCEVAITLVHLTAKDDAHDVGGGRFSLLGSALNKLATAAGVVWDSERSHRIDDNSDPRYVHWKAVGAWRDLAGMPLFIEGDAKMDLRDGSAQVEKILSESREAHKAAKNLLQKRSKILELASTTAKLRAVRSAFGIRAYALEDFARPWVVVKLVFTGRCPEDLEQQRRFADKIADAFTGPSAALFGPPAAHAAPSLPAAAPMRLLPPPPVGTVPADDSGAYDAQPQPQPQLPATPTPAATRPRAPRQGTEGYAVPTQQPRPAASPQGQSPHTMKFGRSKGVPFDLATTEDLAWYREAIAKMIADPEKARFRADNEAHLAAIDAEFGRRENDAGDADDRGDRGDDPDKY